MKSWGKIVTFGTIFLVYAGFMLYRLVRDILDEGLTGPNDRVNLKRHRDDIHGDNRRRTDHLPSWPTTTYISPSSLGDDPYIPLIGSLRAFPTAQQAREWICRQRGRFAEGKGLSFAIADAESDMAPVRGIASSALKVLIAFAWTTPLCTGSRKPSLTGRPSSLWSRALADANLTPNLGPYRTA